jgi:hypothetical protein
VRRVIPGRRVPAWLMVGMTVLLAAIGAPRSVGAQLDSTFLSRFAIHAYANFAYGISGQTPWFGLPTDGSVDYDRAAVLVKYAFTSSDHLVVQIAHRDLGSESSVSGDAPLLLDWLFFEHRFGDNTQLRIGQEPIPIGIYNETRYVGVLLPFYRVPFSVYSEGAFTQETIQGAVVTQTIARNSPFSLEINAWGGQFNFLEQGTAPTDTGTAVFTADAEAHNVIGGFAWVHTPIQGLRLGGGAMHYGVQGGALATLVGPSDATNYYASVDGDFSRFQIRSEWMREYRAAGRIATSAGYVQAGVEVIAPVTLNAQLELLHLHIEPATQLIENVDLDRDIGLGVDVKLPLNAVFKLEGHLVRGYQADDIPPLTGAPAVGRYAITSVSFAF